jgi:hypothetical protein
MRTRSYVFVVLGFIGLTVTRNPRFELFHAVDVSGLMGSGVCFGVALALAISNLRVSPSK